MFSYEEIKSLNELEMLVYNFVIANMEQVTGMTIRALAQYTHVSTSTILRFCSKMKCEGYAEFKYKLKEYLSSSQVQQVNGEGAGRLLEYFQKVNTEEFVHRMILAASSIAEKEKVFLVGCGASESFCRYGARLFSRGGKFSVCLEPESTFLPRQFDAADSAVILLSVSGETQQVIECAAAFKAARAVLISITNTRECTIARLSDYNVAYYMPVFEESRCQMAVTQVPVLYILEMLAENVKNQTVTASLTGKYPKL